MLFFGEEGVIQNVRNRRLHKHSVICDIIPMKDTFVLNFEVNEILSEKEDLWLSLQHSYDIEKGYRIHKGDVIKFGSVLFTVHDIGNVASNENETLLDLSSLDLVKAHEGLENNRPSLQLLLNHESSRNACRICLDDKWTSRNPLISPCKCKGTMEYIHLECLRKMICMDVVKRSYAVTFFVFTSLYCDLCQTRYSSEIKNGNQADSLYFFDKPQGNYIVFLHSLKNKEIFVLVQLEDEKSIAIGKTPLVDIPFPDFSMSYVQAMISYSKGHYYLADLKSKYGTYIKIPRKFNVLPFHKITLQMNHFFLTFSMKKTLIAYLTCYFPKHLSFKSYNDYFSFLSKTKGHKSTICKKILSKRKKILIKSMLNSKTPSFLLKTNTLHKQSLEKSKNTRLQCFHND